MNLSSRKQELCRDVMTSCSSHPLLEAGLLKNEQMADLFGDDEHSDKRHLNEENEAFRKK